MVNANDVRKAHKILDDLFKGNVVLDEEREFLRSFLPELPKQKTLEEITAHVYDAWLAASDYEFNGNEYDPDVTIEDWLLELHKQLQGLKDTPVAVPAFPAGMRMAKHEEYGRCVVSPGRNHFGQCMIFVLDSDREEGSDWHYEPSTSLTFFDTSPTARAHPEFLETEADYQNAPEGTIVACEDSPPCHKFGSEWSSVLFYWAKDDRGMSRAIRRVLRWSWGNE